MTVGTLTYITAEQYQAYADTRGITPNAATLDADLVLSSDFINTYYTLKDGYALPSTDTAKLAEMEKAACKAMEMQQKGLLTLDLAALSAGVVQSESKSLDGVGSKSVTYEAGTRATWKPRVPQLDLLMKPFIAFGSTGLLRG
jgi:Tfp pilus assembly protein PilE